MWQRRVVALADHIFTQLISDPRVSLSWSIIYLVQATWLKLSLLEKCLLWQYRRALSPVSRFLELICDPIIVDITSPEDGQRHITSVGLVATELRGRLGSLN
jgi:hypothetical protein